MKKFMMLGVLVLSGMAGAVTLPEIFSTSETALTAACDDGYRIESMPRTSKELTSTYQEQSSKANKGKYLRDARTFLDMKADPIAYFAALIGYVDIQTPSGSAYNICGARASKLAAKPEPKLLSSVANALVYIAGDVKERRYAEEWNAVLVPLDAAGKELARIEPSSSSKKGDLNDWKTSCTSSGCKWVGKNVYYFTIGQLDPRTVTLRLMFTRGKGIEQREYKAEDFEKGYLSDPKAP